MMLLFLFRTLSSRILKHADEDVDSLTQWILASITAGPDPTLETLTPLTEASSTPTADRRHMTLSSDTMRRIGLPISGGRYDLARAADINRSALVGCHALIPLRHGEWGGERLCLGDGNGLFPTEDIHDHSASAFEVTLH